MSDEASRAAEEPSDEVSTAPSAGQTLGVDFAAASPSPSRGRMVRDALVLQLKLFLEGMKDVVLGPVAIGASILDLIRRPPDEQRLFYSVLRAGERFERFLGLYSRLPERRRRPDAASEQTVDRIVRWGERRLRRYVARPARDRGARAPDPGPGGSREDRD